MIGVLWGPVRAGWAAAWFCLAGLLVLPGCAQKPAAPGAGREGQGEVLRIAAASDLQLVLPRLVDAYLRENRHAQTPEPMFGASGQLARQIEQGAPIDLFLSADRAYVDRLVERSIVDRASARDYTRGVLCLVVHDAAGSIVNQIDDLARDEVRRIAIANPETAPYGRAAREALKAAGLWERLEPRIVFAENVRQALQFVTSGNAEAGLVGYATAAEANLERLDLDTALYSPIAQRLGVVRNSAHQSEARRFADFLLGDSAQAILLEAGFQPPVENAGSPSPIPQS